MSYVGAVGATVANVAHRLLEPDQDAEVNRSVSALPVETNLVHNKTVVPVPVAR